MWGERDLMARSDGLGCALPIILSLRDRVLVMRQSAGVWQSGQTNTQFLYRSIRIVTGDTLNGDVIFSV